MLKSMRMCWAAVQWPPPSGDLMPHTEAVRSRPRVRSVLQFLAEKQGQRVFFNFRFIFNLKLCICVFVAHKYSYSHSSEGSIESPTAGVTGSCESPPTWAWQQNSSHLQEQRELFTAEPSVQPRLLFQKEKNLSPPTPSPSIFMCISLVLLACV